MRLDIVRRVGPFHEPGLGLRISRIREMSDLFTRRDLIKGGTMIAVGLVAPRWLATIAEADVIRQAKGGSASGDTVLVVCQLSGGNDGLNTVVPYANK